MEGVYTSVPVYTNLIPIIIKMNSSVSSSVISAPVLAPVVQQQQQQQEQLDKLEEVLQEFPLPLCVECCQHGKIENSIIGYIQPNFSVVAEICTDGEIYKEVYPNCMAFVTECYALWEYEHPYLNMTSAQGILRSLFVGKGSWKDTSLWYMYRRFPGNMEDAGYTARQMAGRRRLANLIPGNQFRIRGKRIVLASNHLFQFHRKVKMSCAMAVKETIGREVSEEEAEKMIFLTGDDKTVIGYDLSLDEILSTFTLFKLRHLGHTMEEYDSDLTKEIHQLTLRIGDKTDKISKITLCSVMMDFLHDNALDFIKRQPEFYIVIVSKCHEIMEERGEEYLECQSCCQRLLNKILPIK